MSRPSIIEDIQGFEPFRPPAPLKNPHVQTLLASIGRRGPIQTRAAQLLANSHRAIVECTDGVRLEAWVTAPDNSVEATTPTHDSPPTIVLIHGWLGGADSSYVLSVGAELFAAGFRVARLNLRDHGGTEGLNEGLFHSARTREVVDAVRTLAAGNGGVMGFSLGGNFALRVARELMIPTLAVCPAVDPANTMRAIDSGWAAYRWYFMRKWHGALRAKQAAFPAHYDFGRAFDLRTVQALTDLFVADHTEYVDSRAYLDSYTLTGAALAGTRATIVMAEDDPIIPWRDFDRLADSIELINVAWGGHCGFVEGRREASWIDRFAVRFFSDALRDRS